MSRTNPVITNLRLAARLTFPAIFRHYVFRPELEQKSMARPRGALIIFITLPWPGSIRFDTIRFDSSANSYMEFPDDKKNAHKGH